MHECRVFGKISKKPSDISYYFFDAENSLEILSKKYPHGWGIGWYENGRAKVFKEGMADVEKYNFSKVREVNSNPIIAHVRETKRTNNYSTVNAHPFECNNWLFAHNGGIMKNREPLINHLNEDYKKKVVGDTCSIAYFLNIMQNYEECNDIVSATRKTLEMIKKEEKDYSGLNFVLTDGKRLCTFRDTTINQDIFTLHYTTPGRERDNKSVVFSSEPLTNDEKWFNVELGQMIIADSNLKIEKIMLR